MKRALPNLIRLQLQNPTYKLVRHIAFGLFVLCYLGLFVRYDFQTEALLLMKSKTTTAYICMSEERVWHDVSLYEHLYTFETDDGLRYFGTCPKTNEEINIDTTLQVQYSPYFPSRNIRAGLHRWGYLALPMLSLFAGLLWITSRYDFFSHRNLQVSIGESGLFTTGRIEARVRDKKSATNRYRYYITYRTNENEQMKEVFLSEKKLEIGLSTLIIYLPQRPKQFLVAESLPVRAHLFFKKAAGYKDFAIQI